MEFAVINYGGIITEIKVPDKNGVMQNVIIAFDTLEDYLQDTHYIGALIGRYANRICNGRFQLHDKTIQLSTNNFPHHLHGGSHGFHNVIWKITENTELQHAVRIAMEYFSADGMEGYPGNLSVKATYTITENSITLVIEAVSDQHTIFNPTQHSYFNLSGDFTQHISDHLLQIPADKIVEVNAEGIPSGLLTDVSETHFDFRSLAHLHNAFDNTWAFQNNKRKITLHHPLSCRLMDIQTDSPCAQVYTSNFFEGNITCSGGALLEKQKSICLEPMGFPDSPNNPNFPSAILPKGELFRWVTNYSFHLK